MSLDDGRRPVATCGLGRDLTRIPEARVPTDRAGLTDTEALGRMLPRGSCFYRFDDTLTQIDQQS
ncbi:hypothetical protein GGR33_005096 [Methylobacterium brachythecii]|uniref:Uncharacterized protein n=1 Tax=Methylobacterium brachythecii TaxID=1176177 RepID=A0A7W6F9W7_9HYPH|nr:hypothetical protein [Methylobacterium brachythecii]GLS46543.1 hypothetical protein GCM10007884_45370 [Methylobacterium brachythecii]